ncbi:hypothetical protein TVAG_349220 [Trichomonas vaginalis G3]|uniref:Uncharacterized protein n=1 Tax=Trichomonas vaginalis (strain ATCC PRA-98 / G3) TaxID=412133 RepID=A2HLB7_TRIV3|nr:hypothetical protein TVAG_349220 [Trichomonas vaginalis G3]|eukprot:XP_001282730.1 hypothetical protein [Trichomonas vaginalis G3]
MELLNLYQQRPFTIWASADQKNKAAILPLQELQNSVSSKSGVMEFLTFDLLKPVLLGTGFNKFNVHSIQLC